jgi:hypothetical protein
MFVRRTSSYPLSAIALTIVASVACGGEPGNLGFEVPKGFEVALYADDSLATDIHMLTVDSKGRVVVAGKGYIKILHENDKGIADRATLFADFPKSGAHGMVFDGDDLICNGDQGVRRLYDTQGVGKCDKVSPRTGGTLQGFFSLGWTASSVMRIILMSVITRSGRSVRQRSTNSRHRREGAWRARRVRLPRRLARTSVCATFCFAIRCDAVSSSMASKTDNVGRRVGKSAPLRRSTTLRPHRPID